MPQPLTPLTRSLRIPRAVGMAALLLLAACGSGAEDQVGEKVAAAEAAADRAVAAQRAAESAAARAARYNNATVIEEEPAEDFGDDGDGSAADADSGPTAPEDL